MSQVKIYHRKANKARTYREMSEDGVAECDLVRIWGRLYLFHPGGIFTLFMAGPLLWFFRLTWFFWRYSALPYEELLSLSEEFEKPILLELKNISVDALEELPKSLHHIDTYDLRLAKSIKAKFPQVRLSLHLLWCGATGGLVLRSNKGMFRWLRWEELQEMDIITPTYQLSSGWFSIKFWQELRQNVGKPIYLGGGFRGRFYGVLARNFNDALEYVDGRYER